MSDLGVGPWQIAEVEGFTINEVFRQIEEQINQLRGVSVPSPSNGTVSISILVHTHRTTAQGGKLDHGAALTGLGDDDHPQYLLVSVGSPKTDQALYDATTAEHITDVVFADDTLTLAELADGSGDAIQIGVQPSLFLDDAITAEHIGDEVFVDDTLTLIELADGGGDAIQLGVQPSLLLDDAEATSGHLSDQVFVDDTLMLAELADGSGDALSIGIQPNLLLDDAQASSGRISDQVMVGEDLTLSEPGEMAGDSIFLDVATTQTLDDGNQPATDPWEMVVDGLAELQNSIDSTGRLHVQGQNRFRYLNSVVTATKSTAQTGLANNATVVANFDAEDFDTDALHDTVTSNSRLTAAFTGKYLACFSLYLDGTNLVSPTFAGAHMIVNGAATPFYGTLVSGASASLFDPSLSGAALLSLTAGDYIEVVGRMNGTSGTWDLGTAVGISRFGLMYLGE